MSDKKQGIDYLRDRLYKTDGNGASLEEIKAVLQYLKNVGCGEAVKKLGLTPEETTTQGGNIKHHAKILIFDIETAPLKAYVWSLWKNNVYPKDGQLLQDWFMLTWAAKWLFDDKVIAAKLTPEEVAKEDDSRITKLIWELLNEADIIIAHNALKFDNKRLNTRFLKNGLPPPLPYQTIDTLIHARKKFSISSNRLDYIGEYLNIGRKIDTGGFRLWKRCLDGDEKAMEEMEVYNIQDVKLLEDVYLILRPYIQPHPNIGLFIEENVECCPSCGSTSLYWGGTYATYANLFDAFRCNDCGSIGRSRKTSLTVEQKRFLNMSVPR